MPSGGWDFSAGYAPEPTGSDVLPPWWRSEAIWFPGQVPAAWIFPGSAANALGITIGPPTSNPVSARPIGATFWQSPDPSSILPSSPAAAAAQPGMGPLASSPASMPIGTSSPVSPWIQIALIAGLVLFVAE